MICHHFPKRPLAHGTICCPPPFLLGALFCWDCIFILCSFIFANRESNVWGLCFDTGLTSCLCCYTHRTQTVTFLQTLEDAYKLIYRTDSSKKAMLLKSDKSDYQKMETPPVIWSLRSLTQIQAFKFQCGKNRKAGTFISLRTAISILVGPSITLIINRPPFAAPLWTEGAPNLQKEKKNWSNCKEKCLSTDFLLKEWAAPSCRINVWWQSTISKFMYISNLPSVC